jgi:sugar/nucleoside kinase (ribokinase family)
MPAPYDDCSSPSRAVAGSGSSALVVGGVSWNHLVYVDRFPAPVPQTVFASGHHETVGSSGAGKALNLAYLGWNATLWAPVGDDEAGGRVRRVLDEAGVELRSVIDPRGTMRHVNLMDANGDRISIFANPATPDLAVDADEVIELALAAELVSVTIFEYCRALLAPLREAGVRLWIDVHDYDGENPYHDDFIAAADHLQVSSVILDGWRSFAESRIDAGATTVACTHGRNGASVLTAAGWVDVDARHIDELVDTNGAGDAWFAGFATSWLGDGDPARAADAGAVAAAEAVTSVDLAPRRPRR